MHTHMKYETIIHLSNTTYHIVPKILMILKNVMQFIKLTYLKPNILKLTCNLVNTVSSLHVRTVHQWRLKHFIIQQMYKYIIRI